MKVLSQRPRPGRRRRAEGAGRGGPGPRHLQKPQKVTPAPSRPAGRARPHTPGRPAARGLSGPARPPAQTGAQRGAASSRRLRSDPAVTASRRSASQVCQSRRAGRCCRRRAGRMSLVLRGRPPASAITAAPLAIRPGAGRDIWRAGIGDRDRKTAPAGRPSDVRWPPAAPRDPPRRLCVCRCRCVRACRAAWVAAAGASRRRQSRA